VGVFVGGFYLGGGVGGVLVSGQKQQGSHSKKREDENRKTEKQEKRPSPQKSQIWEKVTACTGENKKEKLEREGKRGQ